MSDLADPVISFDRPPPSPEGPIVFDLRGPWRESEPQQTPKRKARFIKTQPRKKKQAFHEEKTQGNVQLQSVVVEAPPDDSSSEPQQASGWQGSYDGSSLEDTALSSMDTDQEHADEYGGVSDATPTVDLENTYALFVEAVQAEECGFFQLSRTLFVANGWDLSKKTSNALWYHLNQVRTATGVEIACLCPEAKASLQECLHTRFLREHGEERFPPDPATSVEEDRTFLFSRFFTNLEDNSDPIFNNIFSVYSPGLMASIKTRAIVVHEGDDAGSGVWTCSKDSRVQNCPHIISARDSLQQHIQCNWSARDSVPERDFLVFNDASVRHASQTESVSYRPIPPAVWARIPGDPQPPEILLIEQAPSLIKLDLKSSCCCSPHSRIFYDPNMPVTTISCEIYGLTRMWTSIIEVQKCPSCKRRNIGRDCREMGLFNWNNRVLFMHNVLEDYTSSYTSSETPIRSWVLTISRRYLSHNSAKFVSHKRFAAVWFAYAKLLELNGDMTCPKCGPTPKVTIWDGVTLAFNRKNILPSLRPPTAIHKDAPIREETRYPVAPQCFEKKDLRKSIRLILSGPPLDPSVLDFVEEEDGSAGEHPSISDQAKKEKREKQKASKAMRERLDLIPEALEKMSRIDSHLGQLFMRLYGTNQLRNGTTAHDFYRQLFLQFAAEESVLQLITRPSLINIEVFLRDPSLRTLPQLTMVPALYNVIQHELVSHSAISVDMLGTCRWLLIRGWSVLLSMMSGTEGEERHKRDVKPEDNLENWMKTGCCYSMPQIRHRPYYPRLAKDGQVDKGGRDSNGEGCQKYYLKYGQQGLTGGLMCVWCSHSICYGFHCIPIAEGRNEVFSAIYTHWESAPEFVVYDFACNLEPYCMTREADFFADTTFVIDKFHSTGHTKCGKASFLNTYVPTNPSLVAVNDSAAECGNGGVDRIRKSVSYMTQERAIVYAKVYFSYFNRAQVLRMLENRKKYTQF